MKKLFLHHCCAPCSPKIIEILSEKFEIDSLWFNPNIYPGQEYFNRLNALKIYYDNSVYNGRRKVTLFTLENYTNEKWIEQIKQKNIENEPERCKFCYTLRLNTTIEEAKRNGIKNFSTTLLSSPHQKHQIIKDIGYDLADKENINFVYYDFRQFYYEGKKIIRSMNLYIQKYCGCIFSKKI